MKRLVLTLIALITLSTNLIYTDNIHNSKAFLSCNQKIPNLHTLDDIINSVSKTYTKPILEAISTIVPREDIHRILFEPLLGFSLSKVFSFEFNGQKFVLRLLAEKKPRERRIAEVNAHKMGVELEIAPKLFFVDENPLVMVMEFIEGRNFSRNDLDNNKITYKVMQALKKFHQYSGKTHLRRVTIAKFIQERYNDSLAKGVVFPSCFESLYNKLQDDYAKLESEYVPSHGDINDRNIIIGNDQKIFLIDWDLSNYEHPFFNIGWLSSFTVASDEQIKNLLRGYYNGPLN